MKHYLYETQFVYKIICMCAPMAVLCVYVVHVCVHLNVLCWSVEKITKQLRV